MSTKKEFDNKKKSPKSSKKGLGFAVWLVLALILFLVFIVNQNRIYANLKQTGFFDRLFGKTPSFVENARIKEPESEKNDVEPLSSVEIDLTSDSLYSAEESSITLSNDKARSQALEADRQKRLIEEDSVDDYDMEESGESETIKYDHIETAEDQNEVLAKESYKSPSKSENKTDKVVSVKKTENINKTVPSNAEPVMNIKLFFMVIGSDGAVSSKEINRKMKKSGSPLTDSINALITGPTAQEQSEGCRTLISNGTRLLGASVKNGVATLNFSSEFEFNQYGIEGSRGQLEQIVYTATAFPTVDSVQFLIDGERRDYLGLEGVWIGSPLNRNSF